MREPMNTPQVLRVARTIILILSLSALLCASDAPERVVAGSQADGGGGAGAGVCAHAAGRDGNDDGECVNGDGSAAADVADGVDAERLDLLLEDGLRALTEEADYRRANSIFEDIAREHPHWDEMHAVQKYNGMALARLGDGSKAYWCFRNAVLLADAYPGKQKLRRMAGGVEAFKEDTSRTLFLVAKEFFDRTSDVMGERIFPDARLMYSAAQLAYAAGKAEEAQLLNSMLLQMDPNHGGARLLAVTMNSEDDEEDLIKLREAVQDFEQLPWDSAMAWAHIGGLECKIRPPSNECVDAWTKAFEYATSVSPMDKEIAIKGVTNAANIMLKQDRPVEEVRRLGEEGVRLGLLNAPLQLPGQLVRGVSFSPWRDDARTWNAVRHLEEHFETIREEVLAAYESGGVARDGVLDPENLHTAGEWRELYIVNSGRTNDKALRLLPRTSKVVMTLSDGNSMVLGGSKLSVMEPGTVVRPHTGSTNARLRIHMGIRIPENVFLRVNNETRTWTEGRCVVIDDSYVHEVWHRGAEKRIVLIVDVWHPELDAERREDSIADPAHLDVYRMHQIDPKIALAGQGVPEALIPDRFISERGVVFDSNEKGTT